MLSQLKTQNSALKTREAKALGLALAVGLLALALAYQSTRPIYLDIGGQFDGPHTPAPGFHAPEESGQANFRWAGSSGSLLFQGIGRPLSPVTVRLQLSSGRGAGSPPVQVGVAVNGHQAPPLQLKSESAAYTVSVDPSWIDGTGDLRIAFSAPTFKRDRDRRELGFVADFARVELPAGPIVPSLSQIAWLLVAAGLLYRLARAVWLRPRVAGALAAVFLVACAAVVATQRLLLTVFTPGLAATLVIALLLTALTEPVVRAIARSAGWRGDRAVPEWAWAGLRALLVITAVVKIGGLLYPHTFIIDSSFHLRLITYMAEGRPWDQYFGKSLALSVMPKEEWGSARAFIPYSPFYYVVAAPLYWLPVPLAVSVPVFSGILETLKVAWVFLLGLALSGGRGSASEARAGDRGRGQPAILDPRAPPPPPPPTPDPRSPARRALASAAIYAAIPATFLLQQWGNWPTQTSLWLLTLWAAITCLFWGRLTQVGVWAVSTFLLLLTLLSYTVTAAYTGLFIGMLAIGGWLLSPGERRRWGALALSLVVATMLSLVIYYGQWVPTILQETLPTFGQAVEEQGKLTTLRPTFWSFLTANLGRAMQSYNLAIIYAMGLAGALWLLLGSARVGKRRLQDQGLSLPNSVIRIAYRFHTVRNTQYAIRNTGPAWSGVWLGAWLLTFPLFALLDFWVDQALKEFWYPLPAIAVVAATWALRLVDRGSPLAARALVWLLFATLAWQSLSLWVFRLLFHNR